MTEFTRFSGQLVSVLILWWGYVFLATPVVRAQTSPPEAWYPVTSLPVALADRNAILHNGFIYVLGGKQPIAGNPTKGLPLPTVYRNAIGPGVTLASTWARLGDFVRGRHNHATVATNTFVYTVGGISGDATEQGVSTSIYYSQFVNNNNLTGWSETKRGKLPYSVYAHDAVAHNGYLYTVGGANDKDKALRSVYHMPIKADGSLGTGDYTTSLPHSSLHHALVSYQNWLYVIGGTEDQGKTVYSHIYRATINPNGTLGNWIYLTDLPDSSTNPQPKGRYHSEALIRNGQLVVLGGRNHSDSLVDVLSAPLLADGTLGPWQFLAPLPAPRHRFGAVLGEAGQIYVTAGLELTGGTVEEDGVYHAEVYVLAQPPGPLCYLANNPVGALSPQARITYTINCKMRPTFPVTGVSVVAPLPANIRFVSADQGGTLSIDQTQVVWLLGDHAPNGEFTVTYHGEATATVTPGSVIINPGATIGWQALGTSASTLTNLVVNSSLQIFLPTIRK